jgi:hypothetical protein
VSVRTSRATRSGLLDHRFIGLVHRHRRLLARDGVNAKAEGRRYCRVSSERQEAPGHCVGKLAITRQVGGQAVVAQIHQTGIRPKPSERRLDRRNRMFQGMDESDAHLV